MSASVRQEPMGGIDGAVFFGKGGGGQHHIRQPGGFGEVKIGHGQEFKVLQGLPDLSQGRIAEHGVFAHDVHAADHPVRAAMGHIHQGEAGRGGEFCPPGLFEFFAHKQIRYRLVTGEDAGQGPHIAGPLDIALAA